VTKDVDKRFGKRSGEMQQSKGKVRNEESNEEYFWGKNMYIKAME
jgi:hypothetical protein